MMTLDQLSHSIAGISERIRQRRTELGLSQQALGERCGMNPENAQSRISRFESQTGQDITLATVATLACALELPLEKLVLGDQTCAAGFQAPTGAEQ